MNIFFIKKVLFRVAAWRKMNPNRISIQLRHWNQGNYSLTWLKILLVLNPPIAVVSSLPSAAAWICLSSFSRTGNFSIHLALIIYLICVLYMKNSKLELFVKILENRLKYSFGGIFDMGNKIFQSEIFPFLLIILISISIRDM